jgi:hypothetical protein
LKIGSGSDFTVTFTLDGHVPQTLTVHSTMSKATGRRDRRRCSNPVRCFRHWSARSRSQQSRASRPGRRLRAGGSMGGACQIIIATVINYSYCQISVI